MILAGDVGGTKVDLALYNFDGGKLNIVHTKKFPASGYASLQDVVLEFLKDPEIGEKVDGQVVAACFGCPGPVKDGHLKLTNLPWELDARDLSKILNIEHIFLINDLEANGYGIASSDRTRSLSWRLAISRRWDIAHWYPREPASAKPCWCTTRLRAAIFRCPARADMSTGLHVIRSRSRC